MAFSRRASVAATSSSDLTFLNLATASGGSVPASLCCFSAPRAARTTFFFASLLSPLMRVVSSNSTTASSKRSVMPMTSKCVATTALAHATPPAAVYSQQVSASFAWIPPIHSVKLSFFAAQLISPHHAPARRK